MLGGGHVRRRSLDSAIDCSPCHGRKTTGLQVQDIGRVLRFEQSDDDEPLPTPLPLPDPVNATDSVYIVETDTAG